MNALTASACNNKRLPEVTATTKGWWGNEEMHEVLNNLQAA